MKLRNFLSISVIMEKSPSGRYSRTVVTLIWGETQDTWLSWQTWDGILCGSVGLAHSWLQAPTSSVSILVHEARHELRKMPTSLSGGKSQLRLQRLHLPFLDDWSIIWKAELCVHIYEQGRPATTDRTAGEQEEVYRMYSGACGVREHLMIHSWTQLIMWNRNEPGDHP